MFDHTHYVPVLRWKQAEQHALRDLFPWVKSQFTPLIEAPERGSDNPDSLHRYPSSLLKMWGTAPFFFDFGPFSSGVSPGTYEDFFGESRSRGLSIIPVTGLATNDVLHDAIGNRDGHGLEICLRLFRDDLDRGDLTIVLDDLLERLRSEKTTTHIVLDLKAHQPSDGYGLADCDSCFRSIPRKSHWTSCRSS